MKIKKVKATGLGSLRSSLYGALRALFFRANEKERSNSKEEETVWEKNKAYFSMAAPLRINEEA